MRLSPLLSLVVTLVLLPSSALALEGIGPRVTVTGTVQEVRLTEKQKFDQVGGTLIVKASNGQIVTIILQDMVQITSEGRLSRKALIPSNITPGMLVRVRGWRIDSQSLSASLIIIQNIQLNPILSLSGILQSIDGDKISVLLQDGQSRMFTVTNETVVNLSYELSGASALQLTGKQVLLTLNPENSSLVRILRITGNKPLLSR